ncbi:MAG TPA: hypothetical protein VFI91_05855 [Longimicrobiaceae bacterium]|nr:hypothetical protein [Longimicrobiaceae bacterium]
MRILRIVSVVSALLVIVAGSALAQERQVPIDDEGRIEVVDLELARRIGLWVDEYPGFQEARLFEGPDSTYVLEITTLRQGQLSRERIVMSAAEAASLRARVGARLNERAPAAGLNQEGRYLLLGQTTLSGALFYGWALPYAVGADDAGAAGLYLATTAGSFFVPFIMTRDQPVTFGMANLSRFGVSRGILHGGSLYSLIRGEEEPEVCTDFCFDEEDVFERGRAAVAITASVAEGLGGYLWARNERMSAGTANTIAGGGDVGFLWGWGLASVLGDADLTDRLAAGAALLGAASGIVGGHSLAANRNYTWGDADMLYTAAFLGGYTGLATTDLLGINEDKAIIVAAIAGSAGGIIITDRMVMETDFTPGQATLNRLGAIAGGLAGAAIGVLVEEETVAVAGGAIGAVLGFVGTYHALAPAARNQRGDGLSNWDVEITPHAALAALGSGATPKWPVPVLQVRYRFGGD